MKALHEIGFSLRAACDCQHGWFSYSPSGISSGGWVGWKAGNCLMCEGIGLIILSGLWCRQTLWSLTQNNLLLLFISKPSLCATPKRPGKYTIQPKFSGRDAGLGGGGGPGHQYQRRARRPGEARRACRRQSPASICSGGNGGRIPVCAAAGCGRSPAEDATRMRTECWCGSPAPGWKGPAARVGAAAGRARAADSDSLASGGRGVMPVSPFQYSGRQKRLFPRRAGAARAGPAPLALRQAPGRAAGGPGHSSPSPPATESAAESPARLGGPQRAKLVTLQVHPGRASVNRDCWEHESVQASHWEV